MSLVTFSTCESVAIVKMNRPEKLNAISVEMIQELSSVFNNLEMDDSVKVIILTGEGRAFSAGADIEYMANLTPPEAVEYAKLGQILSSKIENCSKPTIAAINGYALAGGVELTLAFDIRIASENARFGQTEVTIGASPFFGGSQRLQRVIGFAKAKEMIFTGRQITANEAKEIGLVNQVVPLSSIMEEAIKMANMIANNSFMAVKMSKVAINKGRDTDIETGLAVELYTWGLCCSHPERTQRMSAFLQRSKK
ncbi:MAG: enoyl-CoA hydratase/isomerase family protein [Thaumarchaeota archaeon]|nr:enoyl-CoA hydratase/isomerase family protein [Nitrososphaerota archaeon]